MEAFGVCVLFDSWLLRLLIFVGKRETIMNIRYLTILNLNLLNDKYMSKPVATAQTSLCWIHLTLFRNIIKLMGWRLTDLYRELLRPFNSIITCPNELKVKEITLPLIASSKLNNRIQTLQPPIQISVPTPSSYSCVNFRPYGIAWRYFPSSILLLQVLPTH